MTTVENAPIVLFVFNRPKHTQITLNALLENKLACDTDIFIYADAPRNVADFEKTEEVKRLIYGTTGFKSITVIEREENYGLARNIIDGVTTVCEKYGRTIVLEDDIVTSPAFLQYMNNALSHYENNMNVWHISGWNYPIDPSGLPECFLWREMSCWGWGTWNNRWKHYKKNPLALTKEFTAKDIREFNLDGHHNFWSQVIGNLNGTMNTWAIFWYATIFSNNGLCLNATTSLVKNIGFDDSGENCGSGDVFSGKISLAAPSQFPSEISENNNVVYRIKKFYKFIKIKKTISYINKIARRKNFI